MMNKLKEWWTYKPEEEALSNDSVHKPLTFDKRRNALPLLILGFTWGFLITGLLIGGTIGPYLPFYSGHRSSNINRLFGAFYYLCINGHGWLQNRWDE